MVPVSFLARLTQGRRPPAVVLIPGVLVGLLLVISPVYLSIRTLGAGTEAWDLLVRPNIMFILLRTLALIFSVTAGCIALALPLAWLTVRTDLPFRRFWSVTLLLPLVLPSYVGGLVAISAFGAGGILQEWLDALAHLENASESGGFPLSVVVPTIAFLVSLSGLEKLPAIEGFFGSFLVLTLLSYPYVLLTLRAAMWRLDPSLEESSRALGRNSWATFVKVILPLLRPSIASGGLLVALYTLSDFGAVSLLRYETFTWAIFVQYESGFSRTLGAAMSLALVVVALGLVAAEGITRSRSRYYRSGEGVSRPASLLRLRWWKWPALGLCAGVVLTGLAIPVAVLLFWLVRGVAAGEPLLFLWEALRNSLYASALAAVVTVAAALPIAVLTVRFPGIFSSLLERVSYIGFALPGIAVALGLVFFASKYALFLYQTLAILVAAYLVLFLPTALGTVRASLLQMNPDLEQAARSLGRSSLPVLLTITFPLVRPGILAGAALVFLLTMKELPATLILSPIGFDTLASSIWAASSEAFFARAAAPALLLVLASGLALVFLTQRQQQPS